MTVIWHGDAAEGTALVQALAHNCECKFGFMNVRTSTCAPHQAMVDDQHWLDVLVFERRQRARLVAGEMNV